MNLLIITISILINFVGIINCQGIPGCPGTCPPPYYPVCALDCVNGCFRTYKSKCFLDNYNRCKTPFEPAHTLYLPGECNPRLPECDYCNRSPRCVYDLGLNCFKTVMDDCVLKLHNCQNPKSKWVQLFVGECSKTFCNSCPDDCTQLCY